MVFVFAVQLAIFMWMSYFMGGSLVAFALSSMHFFIALMLLYWLINIHRRYNAPFAVSMATVVFVVHIFYMLLSSAKYYVLPTYGIFSANPWIRFLGTVLISVSIIIALLFYRSWLRGYVASRKNFVYQFLSVNPLFVITGLLILTVPHIIGLAQDILLGYRLEDYELSYGRLIVRSLGKIGYLSAIIAIAMVAFDPRRSLKKTVWIQVILFLLVVVVGYISMKVGGRHMLVFSTLALIIGFSIRSIACSGVMLILFSTIIQISAIFILGYITSFFVRIDTARDSAWWGIEENVAGLTYRTDLSDFAVSLAIEGKILGAGPSLMVDSVVMAVPRFLFPFKYSVGVNKWDSYLVASGYPPAVVVDYPDSIFSMGVGLFGWLGFVFVFPIFIVLVCAFQSILSKFGDSSPLILVSIVALLGSGFYIELDPRSVLTYFRNAFVTMLVFYIIIRFLRIFFAGRWRQVLTANFH